MAFIFVVISVLLACFPELVACSENMRVLQDRLLSNYSVHVRPVLKEEDAVNVNVSMFLGYILELNLKTQTLKTSGYMSIVWRDEYLVWRPEDYGNITVVLLPQTRLWLPDVAIENDIRGAFLFGVDRTNVQLRYDGKVTWQPDFQAETGCKVDIYKYPFDQQQCSITMIPMMTTNQHVILNYKGPFLDSLYTNAEFVLKDKWNQKQELGVTFSSANITICDFYLVLQRRYNFYLLSTVIPLAALSLLIPLAQIVPSDSGEKITLSVNVLLADLIFMGSLSDSIPRVADSVSIFVVYTTLQIILSFIGVVVNVISLCLSPNPTSTTTTTTTTTGSVEELEKTSRSHVASGTKNPAHCSSISSSSNSSSSISSSTSRSRNRVSAMHLAPESVREEMTPWRQQSSRLWAGWALAFARFVSTSKDSLRRKGPSKRTRSTTAAATTTSTTTTNNTSYTTNIDNDADIYTNTGVPENETPYRHRYRAKRLSDERDITGGGGGRGDGGGGGSGDGGGLMMRFAPGGQRDALCFLGMLLVVVCVNVCMFTILFL